MIREEIIIIQALFGHIEALNKIIEKQDKTIKVLEQEPCEDSISRQAVIEHICEGKDCYKKNCKGILYNRCPDIEWVNELPPITPTQEPILDKIRAEIDRIYEREGNSSDCLNALDELKWFIDKYKESEE